MPTLPHSSPGPKVDLYLLSTYYVPHNSNEWDSQSRLQEFAFLRVVLILSDLNHGWFSRYCQLAFQRSSLSPFSVTFHFQWGDPGNEFWLEAQLQSTEGSWRTLPSPLPLLALNENALSRNVAAFMQSQGKNQENHRDTNLEPYHHCAAELVSAVARLHTPNLWGT